MSPTLYIDFHISDGFTNTMTIVDYQALMVGPGAKLEVANLFIEGKPGHIHLKVK